MKNKDNIIQYTTAKVKRMETPTGQQDEHKTKATRAIDTDCLDNDLALGRKEQQSNCLSLSLG